MILSRKPKRHYIHTMEKILCSKHISPKNNGHMIRAFHLSSPLIFILILSLGSNWMIYGSILCIIMIITSFLICNACVLSILEKKLCRDDFNVMHPFLEYHNIEKTKQNLIKASYFNGFSYILIVIIIVYIRLFRNNNL